jgi:arylsulfatase
MAVAAGRIERTLWCGFSAHEGADVGADEGTPVVETYQVPFSFTGKIVKVTIDLKETKAASREEEETTTRSARTKRALSY